MDDSISKFSPLESLVKYSFLLVASSQINAPTHSFFSFLNFQKENRPEAQMGCKSIPWKLKSLQVLQLSENLNLIVENVIKAHYLAISNTNIA